MYLLTISTCTNPVRIFCRLLTTFLYLHFSFIHFHLYFAGGVVHQYCPNSSDEEVDENDYQTEGFVPGISSVCIILLSCRPINENQKQNPDAF